MYTLTLIFNKDMSHVLMCNHIKHGKMNYIGGKVDELEQPMDASYRELFEETGISRNDVDLQFIRQESVTMHKGYQGVNPYSMIITAGILNKELNLIEEKNPLVWVNINDADTILHKTYGDGNCYTFMLQALSVLGKQEVYNG